MLIITQDALHILGPAKMHIDRRLVQEIPPVTCPIVDITALDTALDEEVAQIMKAHVSPFEVRHVDVMIAEFEKIGARVSQGCALVGFSEFTPAA